MRMISFLTAGSLLLATHAYAAPQVSSGLASLAPSQIQLVQAKKDETIKQKVKRVWRNIAGTTYDVGCTTLAGAFTRTTCTETGKDSQAKCIAKHPVCQVSPQK